MGLSPSPNGPQGHAFVQVRPVSWLVLACAAFWAALVLTALAIVVHS
jgi:hypothetical protein